MQFYFLTRREREIIQALAPIVVPETPAEKCKFERRMLYHLDRFLSRLSPVLRWLFHLGATFFDLSPILFFQNKKCFRHSRFAFQQYWVNRIYLTRITSLYQWFHVTRGVILLYYYSQEEQQKELGYFPAEWAKFKIMQRRKQLNLTEEGTHDLHTSRFQP